MIGAFNALLNVSPTMMRFLGLKVSHIFLLRFLGCCFEVFPYYPFAFFTLDFFWKLSSSLISLVLVGVPATLLHGITPKVCSDF